MAVNVIAAAQTDIGCVRRQNQDTFAVNPEHRLYVVCDGMGGAAGGEVASRLATNAFVESFHPDKHSAKDALFHAGMAANQAVRHRAAEDPVLNGMGSTLVGLHVDGKRLLVINIGDSRAYLIRDGEGSQLTVDHSYLDEQVRLGLISQAMADASSLQSVITRAVGIEDDMQPDLYGVDAENGDLALLASDGLTRHVTDTEIAAIASEDGRTAPDADASVLEARCARLIALAKERGGSDNITCILLRIEFSD